MLDIRQHNKMISERGETKEVNSESRETSQTGTQGGTLINTVSLHE